MTASLRPDPPLPTPCDLREVLRTAPPTTLLVLVERWAEGLAQERADAQRQQQQAARAGAAWDPRRWGRQGREALRTLLRRAMAHAGSRTDRPIRPLTVPSDQVQDLLGDLLVNDHLRKDPDDPQWPTVVRHLLDHGARLDTPDVIARQALQIAVFNGADAVLLALPRRMLAEAMGVPTPHDRLPWHLCVGSSSPALVQALLDAGVDPRMTDAEGNTPLHRAVTSQAPENAQLLIAAGVPLDVPNRAGATPLILADEVVAHRRAIKALGERDLPEDDPMLRLQQDLQRRHVEQEQRALRAAVALGPEPVDPHQGPQAPEPARPDDPTVRDAVALSPPRRRRPRL